MSREKALKRINEYLAKQEPKKVELGVSNLVDKLYNKYKSLGRYDVGKYISSVNKITNELKQGIDKNGDLLEEAKELQKKYASIGDKENSNAIQRLVNDLQNDYDEIIFLYDGLRKIT